MRERRDLRVHLSKKFDHQLEFQLNPEFFEKFRKVRKRFIYDFEKNPQGMYDLFNKTVSEYLKDQEKKKQGRLKLKLKLKVINSCLRKQLKRNIPHLIPIPLRSWKTRKIKIDLFSKMLKMISTQNIL